MAGLCSIVCITLLFTLYPVDAQADIYLPSFGNQSYVSKGSDVTLAWTHDFPVVDISGTQWFFIKSEKSPEPLARKAGDTVTILNSSLPNIRVTKQVTLILTNVNLDYNGTYKLQILLFGVTQHPSSEILVIILEQPTAVINYSSPSLIFEEGENITFLCSATGGNPPATASWSKNGMMINGTGYLEKNLTLKNIGARDAGTYNCTVRSHNLTDTKFINITVKYEPRGISFSRKKENNIVTSGDTVNITCKADAFPEASYSISVNGSQPLTGVVNGVYTINSVNDSHAGNYTCVAKNSLGSVSAHFVLTVRARPTPTPTQIMPTRTSNQSASTSTSVPVIKTTGAPTSKTDKPNIGPMVGGAIGGVVFLIICIVLIWYCCCKRSASGSCKRGNGGEEDIVANPANPSYAAMGDSMDRGNPYESVDQAKIDQARDDESGPSNENPPDAGNSLPPVYAVVNKSKKTPKPPPEKQPDSLTYASLDPVVLQPDSSKMRDRTREETNYASIDLEKLKKDQE